MNSIAKQSLLLLSLLLVLGAYQAQPVLNESTREQRQLKGSPGAQTEADVKMLAMGAANITPATSVMQMQLPLNGISGLPFNQMAQLQTRFPGYAGLAGYPGYQGLLFGAGLPPTTNFNGLSVGNYGGYTDPSLGLGLNYPNAGYPGQQPAAGNLMFGSPQLGSGYGQQPTVDNFAALNNIINMANAQGLGGVGGFSGLSGLGGLGGLAGGATNGLYPQAVGSQVGLPMAGGVYGNQLSADSNNAMLERMNMRHYANAY